MNNVFGNSVGGEQSFGFGFNSGIQQQQQQVMAGGHEAVMFVIPPKMNQLGNVGHRPFSYRFDDTFTHHARQVAEDAMKGTSTAFSSIESMMTRQNFAENLTATPQAMAQINTSRLSDFYRFILILTESSSKLKIGQTIAQINNTPKKIRRIYTGYFLDEPFNPGTFSETRRNLNPHAIMVITHKTVVDVVDSGVMQHGGSSLHQKTTLSQEILHPNITMDLAGGNQMSNGLYVMTPANCIKAVNPNGDTGDYYSSPLSTFGNSSAAVPVNDVLENTTQNVAQVMRGMINYIDEVTVSKHAMGQSLINGYDGLSLDADFHMTKLANALELPNFGVSGGFDLDVNSQISPTYIDNLVNGALQVHPLNSERPIMRDMADQMQTDFVNQFSWMIAQVIQPIMNSVGLNSIICEYGIANNGTGVPVEHFQPYHAGTFYELPGLGDKEARVRSFITQLRNGIFKTIYESQGDFHISINAETTGMILIRLSLMAHGHRCTTDFEIPAFINGIITPLIGNDVVNQHNASQIHGLYGEVTGNVENFESFIPKETYDFFSDLSGIDVDSLGDEVYG